LKLLKFRSSVQDLFFRIRMRLRPIPKAKGGVGGDTGLVVDDNGTSLFHGTDLLPKSDPLGT